MANYTDRELGYQAGRIGMDPKYPNNVNYMHGFKAGTAFLIRELKTLEPFEDMRPHGPNEMHGDYYA